MIGTKQYNCGCWFNESGIHLCDLHFTIANVQIEEMKQGLPTEKYSDLLALIEREDKERLT